MVKLVADLTDFEWPAIEPLFPNQPRRIPRQRSARATGIFQVPRFLVLQPKPGARPRA